MRILAILALALALPAAAPPPKAPLPAFDFKGFVAGSVTPAEQLAKCGNGAVQTCQNTNDKIAGVWAITSISFYKGRMTEMLAVPPVDGFPIILRAFTEKYGQPCKTSTETWRNGMGAALENQVVTWCFATGKLDIKNFGATIDKMWVFYADDHVAPEEKPKIDF